MKILLNGQFKDFTEALSLKALIDQLGKNKTPVIAEVNREIIGPEQWEKTALKEGDTVELVSFVGGGINTI